MKRTLAAGALAVLLLAGCGGSAPSPKDVAVQSQDLPGGLVRCPMSGNIGGFLEWAKTNGPVWRTIWQRAQKAGADGGQMEAYATAESDCARVFASQEPPGADRYAYSLVAHFPSTDKAKAAYLNGDVSGVPAKTIAKGPGVQSGAATGLGADSFVFNPGEVYLASYAKGEFSVLMRAGRLSHQDASKAAQRVYGRI